MAVFQRLVGAYVALFCIIMILPVVVVVILAFSSGEYLAFPPPGFGLRWFTAFLGDAQWRSSLGNSFIVAIMSSLLATVIGFMTAYAFVRREFPFKQFLLALMLTPVIAPSVVIAVAMYFMSARLGLNGNFLWLAFCHAVVSVPIVMLIMITGIRAIDANLERAARGLGASRFYVYRRIVIPLAWPSIVSSLLFSFLASFDELIISLFLAGTRKQTLPVRIWNSLHLEVEPVIAAASAFLIFLTCIVLTVNYFVTRRRLQ